jgi:uncharacterized protein (DUF697 family)
MNRKKKLPRAIVWPAGAMREGEDEAVQQQAGARPADADEGGSSANRARADTSSNLLPLEPALSASMPHDIDATRRRSLARAIVERHANYSAVGGIIPLPILNVAGVTAIVMRMVKTLSRHYGVPYERDRARVVVIGLMGGFMPTGFAAVTTSTLAFIVPGSNLIGLAVSSVTASACTRSIGRLFVDHFEGNATLAGFPVVEGRLAN